MKKAILFAGLFLCPLTSVANTWIQEGKITGVYIDLRGSIEKILVRHTTARSGDNCSNNGNYYELNTSSNLSKQAYATLLSLEARSENVRFYVDGCSSSGFPLIQVVDSINVSN